MVSAPEACDTHQKKPEKADAAPLACFGRRAAEARSRPVPRARSLQEPSPLLCAHADRACLAAAQVPSPSQLARTPVTGPTSVAQSIVLAAPGLWCNCGLCSSVRLLLQVLAVARGILALHCCSEIFSWSSGI